ncbi:MAG: tetratricopeptide repeat protein [Chitinispirillales bacterium]|jgi:tetratricopeptide (TPR) repeat protein|nr:tetratricopeptide repeat protein [Chitinispirillales bacterium]
MLLSRWRDKLKNIIFLLVVFFLSLPVGCGFSGNSKLLRQENDTINKAAYSELSSEYFIEGMNALRRGDSAMALNYFETALTLDADSKILNEKVIDISILLNNPVIAVKAIMRGREYSQINDDELRRLGAIYSRYRYFSEAFEAISFIKEKDKKDTIILARVSEQAEKFLYAIELYKTQFSDTSAELQFKIADLYRRSGLFATAESLYLETVRKQPDNIAAKKGLALSLIGQNDAYPAKTVLEEILVAEPVNSEMWYLLGSALEALNDWQNAANAYKKSVEIREDFTDAVWALMVLCTKIGDFETALDLVKRLSEKFPERAEYPAIMGTIYNAMNLYDSAFVVLNKVLELGIRTPTVLFELGMASERTGKFEEAEKYFKEILEINPNYAVAANYLGYMWAEKGINLNEAEKLLISALKEEPDNGAYLDSYGWILFQQKKYKEAEKPLLRSAQLITNDYVVYYHLGELYLKLGKKKEALNYFIKANSFKDNPAFEAIDKQIKDLSK